MASEKAEYRLAPKARQDMEAVWRYLLTQWGVGQTRRYIDALTEAFDLLARSPKAGAACDHIRKNYRRYRVVRHVVYYRATRYGIEVMRVLHDRMLAERHL